MYDIISGIIDHIWDADNLSAEQPIVYAVCSALILIIFVWILDSISKFIINFSRKGSH